MSMGYGWTMILQVAFAFAEALLVAVVAVALLRLGDKLKVPALQLAAAGAALLTIVALAGAVISVVTNLLITSGTYGGSYDWWMAIGGLGYVTGCAKLLGWALVAGGLAGAAFSSRS